MSAAGDDVGLVYFAQITGGGPIKIGFTSNVRARLQSLAIWCPYDLEFLASVKAPMIAETYLLELFRAHQIKGEWFKPHPSLLALIERVKKTRRVYGCPAPPPTNWRHPTHYFRPKFDSVIPAVWPDLRTMLQEVMLQPTTIKKDEPLSHNSICRIVAAARRRGVVVKTADLTEAVPLALKPEAKRVNRKSTSEWKRSTERNKRRSQREMYPEAFAILDQERSAAE